MRVEDAESVVNIVAEEPDFFAHDLNASEDLSVNSPSRT